MAIDSPVDAVEKQYEETPKAPIELILAVGGLALPHAAPILEFVKVFTRNLSASNREERMRAFLTLLRDQEKLLQALSENFDKLKVRVEEIAEAAEAAAWADADAPNDRKRDRYLKIIGNAVRSQDRIEDLAAFIRDVESLGEHDIVVLKALNEVMNKPGDWREPSGLGVISKLHPNTFIQRRQEMAARIAEVLGAGTYADTNKVRFNPEAGYSICARLQGFGLAHEIALAAREVPIGDYCFRPSQRGLMLLRLIGVDVANWRYFFPLEA